MPGLDITSVKYDINYSVQEEFFCVVRTRGMFMYSKIVDGALDDILQIRYNIYREVEWLLHEN